MKQKTTAWWSEKLVLIKSRGMEVELIKTQVQILFGILDVVFGIDGCIDTVKG
jgi:hypothetical protein